jgi:hypothetical protein
MKKYLQKLWQWVTLQSVPADVRAEIFRLIRVAANDAGLKTGAQRRHFVSENILKNPVFRGRLPDEWYIDVLIKAAVAVLEDRG